MKKVLTSVPVGVISMHKKAIGTGFSPSLCQSCIHKEARPCRKDRERAFFVSIV